MPPAAFLPPTPAGRRRPAAPALQRPRGALRARARRVPLRATLSDGDADTLFGRAPTADDHYRLLRAAPRHFVAVTALGLGAREPAPPLAYLYSAARGRAVPAPLSRAAVRDAALFAAAAGCAACPPGPAEARAALARAASFLKALLGEEQADDGLARAAARVAAGARNAEFETELQVLACACSLGKRRVLCAGVEEAPGCEADSLGVLGCVYVADAAVLDGNVVPVGTVERVECSSPAFAVAVAEELGVECFVARYLFDATAVRVRVRDGAVEAVDEDEEARERRLRGPVTGPGSGALEDVGGPVVEPEVVTPWDVDYKSAMALSEDSLIASLKAVGVAVVTTESRESLLRKFADNMDEVERRELFIRLAADRDMFSLAAQLQGGRSERGLLTHDMREAEERNDWDEAFRLKVEVDRLKSRVADPTQDPGSYDPYLDADPWYKPSR